MDKNKELDFRGALDNILDCLNRAQDRLKELGDVSSELTKITDDTLIAGGKKVLKG